MQNEVCLNRLSQDSMKFISISTLDKVIKNQNKLSKCQILDYVINLRDEIERYC